MRIVPLASALAILGASSAVAQTAPRSTAVGTRTTIDSGGRAHSFAERTLVRGSKTRLEMGIGDTTSEIEGMYMVFDTADSSVTSVMPKQRMATIIKMPAMTL